MGFLIIAIIAAIISFGDIVGVAAGFAIILFGISLALFVIGLIMNNRRHRKLHSKDIQDWNFYSKN